MPRQIDSLRRLLNFPRGFNAGERILAIGAAVWRRPFRDGAVDAALGGVGFALAGLSLLFAAEMIRNPHEPDIAGLQYLAIFAQPNSSTLKAAQQLLPLASAPPRTSRGVDYASTASIPERKQQTTEMEPLGGPTNYEILGATRELAWLRRGSEIAEVRRGDYVPGLGKVLSIEQQDGRWRLIVENNSPRLGREAPEAPKRGLEKKLFAKPLIFNDPNR